MLVLDEPAKEPLGVGMVTAILMLAGAAFTIVIAVVVNAAA